MIRRWRLAMRRSRIWLRHFYPFVWAHAPLCDRYGSETVRLGPLFVCRSCAACACGLLAGIMATGMLATTQWGSAALHLSWVIAAGLLGPLLAWGHALTRHRGVRDGSRAAFGVTAGVLLAAPWLVGWWGLVGLPMLLVMPRITRQRKGLNQASRCSDCAYANGEQACPGFARQVRAAARIGWEL